MTETRILIGSRAASLYTDKIKPGKDIDYFSPEAVEGADTFWHERMSAFFEGQFRTATLDELYTIKLSHAYWIVKNEQNWWKHMYHLTQLKEAGAQQDWVLEAGLYAIWELRYGKKKANLEQEPDEFFNPNVDRRYHHDSVHASIAYYDEPLFNRILRDNHAVAVDVAKFKAMDFEDKLRLVREEVYATALERLIIPNNYKYSSRRAYDWAMMKTITSFSKGWFPKFIVENFDKVRVPDVDYVKLHLNNQDKLVLL